MSVRKIHAQIWFIGRTLASQAGKAGSYKLRIPLFYAVLRDFRNKLILSNKRGEVAIKMGRRATADSARKEYENFMKAA